MAVRRRGRVVATLTAAAALATSACGGAIVNAGDEDAKAAETAFVETVRTETDYPTEQMTDDEIIDLGEAVCDELENGVSMLTLSVSVRDAEGAVIPSLGDVVVAAEAHLCPGVTAPEE